MSNKTLAVPVLPGEKLDPKKMPGHWLLARMGKRVLRPGGLELTHKMLEGLKIKSSDQVVEFAPGLGVTAKLTLKNNPASYTAVERDEAAAKVVGGYLNGSTQRCMVAVAEDTKLPSKSATVVYGEAMLTMHTAQMKNCIVGEASRLLSPGGRYGIHELCLIPDDLEEKLKTEIKKAFSGAININANPLTCQEWRDLLEANGFKVRYEAIAPMHLLEPQRLLRDEGLFGAVRFIFNVLRNRDARKRVLAMRRVFKQYSQQMGAVTMVGVKQDDPVVSP